ncbi:HalOD1 output domain-containing protein [Salinarchaeum sp. Harcht-Bsk1]|uniref:HalOD1 output domain-containing protein n=1 Tax=Salinarchaeum sp. Harcht-Bsk1 TaxID=1333523 RepID=UPI000677C179|nr:HalOD1 output domain-containing protein [Salinarchaeum sp. Harcht-Bsk1]
MDSDTDDQIVHRGLDTDVEEPAVRISEHVGDLEDRDPTSLATMHDCVDGVLDHIFSTPPSPEAQIEITFSYEGYRITVEQNGHARFVDLD